jgi:hypothetical protein
MRRVLVASALALVLAAGSATAPPTPAAQREQSAIPLFAYYYQWFNAESWNRAKIDYPQVGRYSSDDPRVMRQHIEWAKSAGIDGFVVSWKSTPTNDRRLHLLVSVARQESFKLAIIYQGLQFDRDPLPAAQVAQDFLTFRDTFASDPVFFRVGDKPLTIFSGTWKYSHAEVAQVTGAVRASMLVLSTEKSIDGYRRLADVTDGDAYYWSSVNPENNKNYDDKLNGMSQAIHGDGKYWMAPFAPGFDARLVGGAKTVERRLGRTLRTEYATMLRSSPDVMGLISWNEFSENTYVEPSHKFGMRYLDVLRELRQTSAPALPSAADSSAEGPPSQHATSPPAGGETNLWLLAAFPAVLAAAVCLLALVRRRRNRHAV